ncbi:hypothetical protein QYF36_008547 [Acer negundo]|nr:hypothetical protein QYF36_008547 [Acer negundo]
MLTRDHNKKGSDVSLAKRIALIIPFFFTAAVSAQDLAPSSAPTVGAGVSLPVFGAVVGFSLDVFALALI